MTPTNRCNSALLSYRDVRDLHRSLHRLDRPTLTRFAPLFCLLGASLGLTQPTRCFAQTTVPTYTVNTFAGSVPNGDDGWAAEAVLRWPGPMVFDKAGNLYIADGGNASVRKVTPNGRISTIAGTGEVGFSGDGGPASRAQLSGALGGLAIDANGNIYISDAGNNCIRKVSATAGRISTFVNGPTLTNPVTGFGFRGIAFDRAGNLYLAVSGKHQIFRFAPDGTFSVFAGTGTSADTGDGGPAVQAAFINPYGLYVDASGAVYVSDSAAYRIRKITPDGIINAFAGTGKTGFGGDGGSATQALLNSASSLTGDAGGNLYLADSQRVRRVAPDGTISTVAGSGNFITGDWGDGGPATQAGMGGVGGLAVSASGDLYISDFDSAIRVVTMADGIVQTAYGKRHFTNDGEVAANCMFFQPGSFTADSQGNFYISDEYRIRKIDTAGVLSTVAGTDDYGNTGDGGPATAASIYRSPAIAVDPSGNVYFATFTSNGAGGAGGLVRRVGTDGIITTVAGGGPSLGDGGPATQARLSGVIYGLAIDSSGSVYIADPSGHRIRKVTPDGTISTFAGTGVSGVTNGDGGPATAAAIQQPRGLVFDAAGSLYFADFAANRVRKISPDGTISAFAGTGTGGESGDGGPATQAQVLNPQNLAIDPTGNVYIADYGGNTVRVVTTDRVIHTIASGTTVDDASVASFAGDGVPAIGTHYDRILGLALDGSGNIYLLEDSNERIRVLTPVQ